MDDAVQHRATEELLEQPSLSEAMIISTCNRLEIYCVTNAFHAGVQEALEVLADVSGVAEAELRTYLYVRYADAAAEHMFTVASGLDSMVVGENQILGQVKTALTQCQSIGTVGTVLNALFQQAIRVGNGVIGALGGEFFAETGLALRQAFPDRTYFTITMANGYVGYVPPAHEIERGGYETWRCRTSFLAPNAESQLSERLTQLIHETLST